MLSTVVRSCLELATEDDVLWLIWLLLLILGPGMYYPKMLETNRGSFVMPKDCRFRKDGMDETPGPGAYEVS